MRIRSFKGVSLSAFVIISIVALAIPLLSSSSGHAASKYRNQSISSSAQLQAPTIKNQNTLVYDDIGDVDSLDPAWAYDTRSSEVIQNVYETLISFKDGKTDEFDPRLADNWTISGDGLTYTFRIRTGVKFQNGDTLTPQDVVYSIKRVMVQDRDGGPAWMLLEPLIGIGKMSTRGENGSIVVPFEQIDNAVKVENGLVVFHLKQPYEPFLGILAQSWGSIVDENWCIAQGDWPGTAETYENFNNPQPGTTALYSKMNGTGPFKLDRWEHGMQVVLDRNDDYWRTPAKLKSVVIREDDAWTDRKLALLAGDADFVYVPRANLPEIENIFGVRIIENLQELTCDAIFFNFEINENSDWIGSGKLDENGIPPNFFRDKDVRLGFAYSFYYDDFIQEAFLGQATRPASPMIDGLPYVNPSAEKYSWDLTQAENHFRQAFGGALWENGFKLKILYNVGNVQRMTAAIIFKNNIESLNPKFSIDLLGVDWATYLSELLASKLPMYYLGWQADFPDPHNFVVPFMSSTGALSRFQHYNNPLVENLIGSGIIENDPAQRQAIYYQLQQIYYDDVPGLTTDQVLGVHVERDWVQGWYYNPIIPGTPEGGDYYPLWKGYGEPIYIDGNNNFTVANGVNGGGSGTENDPYIIENWVISAENANGIDVRDTTAYFIIRNCLVESGLIYHGMGGYNGIYLDNVANGRIENNLIENNYWGIDLEYSDNILMSYSIVENNFGGILLDYASDSTLKNNLLFNNERNFGVYGISISAFYQDIDNSNLINGKPIYYIIGQENLVLDGTTDVGYLGLILCENIIVQNLDIGNNSQAVLFVDTSHSKVTGCTFENNYDFGIYLLDSDKNLISNNSLENNGDGIFLYSSDNNLIENNIAGRKYLSNYHSIEFDISDNNIVSNNIMENGYYGIRLWNSDNNLVSNNAVRNNLYDGICLYEDSDTNIISGNICSNNNGDGIHLSSSNNNRIHHNNIINNATQASDDNSNYWDNGYPSGGNYWSDYTGVDNYRGENQDTPGSDGIGDTPYNISGGSNQDRYPLMTSWSPSLPLTENRTVIYPTADIYAFGEYGTGYSRAQLKFDISSIPPQGRILSAELWLRRFAVDGWAGGVTLDRVDDQLWGENITSGEFDSQVITNEETCAGKFTSSGWDYLDVTDQLNADYLVGNVNSSFRLRGASDNGSEPSIGIDDGRFLVIDGPSFSLFLCSSEYGGSDPYLEVVYVPPYSMSASISPSVESGQPTDVLSYTVTVKNTGNLDDNYLLTVSDNSGWGTTVSPTTIFVASGSTGEATLAVTVPENAAPGTADNVIVTATSTGNSDISASDSCIAQRAKTELNFATLYSVSLDLDIYLDNGSKLVLKFSKFGNYQGENAVWGGITPEHVVISENVPHPLGMPVHEVRLVLTTDNTAEEISTLASLTVRHDDLSNRITWIILNWANGSPSQQDAWSNEITGIILNWTDYPN